MAIVMKAASWSAVAVLFGLALRRYWLAPGQRTPRALLFVAAALLPIVGAFELWHTVGQVRSPVSFDLWWRYASTTAHGHAVMWRSAAGVLLAATVALAPRSWWPLAALFGVWLGYGFSRLSHAAAMGGTVPLLYDLVHLLCAATWAGGVWVVAFGRSGDRTAVTRLSAIALWSVVLLALAGVLSALTHASDPQRFFASGYVVALAVKLVFVAVALTLAAVNRFVLLPRSTGEGGGMGMRRSLYLESGVLLAVLVLTGWLSTSPVPHGENANLDAIENLRRVVEHLLP